MPALNQLEEAFVSAKDPEFQAHCRSAKNYAGRPTALTKCREHYRRYAYHVVFKARRFTARRRTQNQSGTGSGATQTDGESEIIAETGAGQHGASPSPALASALLGLKCRIYMGAKDVERQSPNVSACV